MAYFVALLVEFLQLAVNTFCLFSIDDKDLHFTVKQLATKTNVDGCLDLVSCEYPELDLGILHMLNNFFYFFLELVFDSSRPNKREVSFDGFGDLIHLCLTVNH